ncbi:hypothetical protein BDW74DRAFT_182529 [Aspergillus multicolor]|uniref:ceramidase n=1 Tax=Aspergillus multicolor TaxID=41759 RepID=UPI003CCCE9EE
MPSQFAIHLESCSSIGSNLDNSFCETDYAISRYIAEFINSLSNIVYVFHGIHGLRKLKQKGNGDPLRAFPYRGLMAVGFCSRLLMSFKCSVDDLSTHFATTLVLHRVLTANSTRRNSIVTAVLLESLLFFLVAYHVVTDELLLHSASSVAAITLIGVYIMRLVNARTLPDSAARRQIWGMVRFGAAIFNLGYWLWLLDQWACGFLTSNREEIGLPWAFLWELHGWWHVCTGYGAYVFIAVVDHLVAGEGHGDIDRSFAWPASWASKSVFAGSALVVAGKTVNKRK